MSAKSLDQRLLRLEFLLSILQKQMEVINAEREQSTAEANASDRARRQTEARERSIEESRTGLREG
jgi:hypothetical protein